jgi:glycosyltransferase involved in cell wall biosynthesis
MKTKGNNQVKTSGSAIRNFLDARPAWRRYATELNALFDHEYYLSQLENQLVAEELSLIHYMSTGWRKQLNPHPLFDTSYYLQTNSDVAKKNICPLLHFIATGAIENRDPHPLFFTSRVLSENSKPIQVGSNPLVSYLSIAPSHRRSPCPFFSFEYYRAISPEVDWSREDPLIHYIRIGEADGRWPHPVFDADYYAAFQMTTAEKSKMSPFVHFCRAPAPRRKPFALFSPKQYQELYPDLKLQNDCPVTHFLEHGIFEILQEQGRVERRSPSKLRSNPYIMETLNQFSFADRPPLWEYYRAHLHKRTRILFIGHEATRTGAAAILLNIVKAFSKVSNVEPITVLDSGGPLVDEFARCSHCYVMENNRLRFWSGHTTAERFVGELKEMLELFADNAPIIAVCNSLETRLYAPCFRKLGIPVVSLIHEVADFYPADEIKLISDFSDRLVFSSAFCYDSMKRMCSLRQDQARVIPQGLLRDNFGFVWRRQRAVFRDFNVGNKDIVVAGCGTIDGRKGFDLFVATANLVTKKNNTGKRIHFIWIGGTNNWHRRNGAPFDTISYWASWELEWNKLENIVHVITEVPNTEPYLINSDIFFLSSRLDPFPCVVHEAMACELPVLCFENTGGAPEAIGADAGIVLPYQDINAAAEEILALASNDPRRWAIGRRGRERVLSQYRFADYVERLKELLADAAHTSFARFGEKPRKPAVFFTSPGWNISGVNTFTESLVEYLNQNGFDAQIVFTLGQYGAPRTMDQTNVEYDSEPLPNCAYRWLQPKSRSQHDRIELLRNLLIENAPCLLVPNYDHDIGDIVIDLPSSIGVIGIIHSDSDEYYGQYQRLGRYWTRAVAVSNLIANKIGKLDASFDSKVDIIYYGVEPPDHDTVMRAIQKRNIETGPLNLIYAGRFETAQKRIFDYCELANILAENDFNYHLTMVGNGSEYDDVSSRLAAEISRGRVTLTGRLSHSETKNLMMSAHVFLLFSDFEGLPLSLIESMQRGCVPIVYDFESGIPELIDHGQNGFVVKKGDFSAIIEILRRLETDAELRTKMMLKSIERSDRLGLSQNEMGRRYAEMMNNVFSKIRNRDDLCVARRDDIDVKRISAIGTPEIEIVFSDPG